MPEIIGDWITIKTAASILTRNSGYTVSNAYVQRLQAPGKLESMQVDGRTRLFRRSSVVNYHVRQIKQPA
ncbi:MAG TPA: hypothetical protein VGF67_11730 [Ktedonobacteraceae bacterium]|jgi:hypothetical protein